MSSLNASRTAAPIWWSNSIFFIAIHVFALFGIYYRPWSSTPLRIRILALFSWQAALCGITVGYHRLYSHRAFRAKFIIRVILAALGSMGFQGSIKWWCLRHRLHHRFTDDPVHDPYAATRGFLFSHMGWIFHKPSYERLGQIGRGDLERDPVVTFQHRYYVPIAFLFGFALPTFLGLTFGDTLGAFIWGGLVARVITWHSTFLVNSLAHWNGLQPFSDEDTSRSNLLIALLTCGEGNHNFHTFPYDFRAGPSLLDWDPSKWVIITLSFFNLTTDLRRARPEDIQDAKMWMDYQQEHSATRHKESSETHEEEESSWTGEVWNMQRVHEYAVEKKGRCVLLIDGFLIDVTMYLREHPGGAAIFRPYAIRGFKNVKIATIGHILSNSSENCRPKSDVPVRGGIANNDAQEIWQQATWAFHGGLNNHGRAAIRRMREMRVARVEFE